MKNWDARLFLGFLIVMGIISLAFTIAIAKVTQETSYGLHEVLTILGMLGTSFGGWAYGKQSSNNKDENKPN